MVVLGVVQDRAKPVFVVVTIGGVLFSVITILTVLGQNAGSCTITEYVPGVVTKIVEAFTPVLQENEFINVGTPVTERVMDGLLQVRTVDGVATILHLKK